MAREQRFFKRKLSRNAPTSVEAMTGTATRTTMATPATVDISASPTEAQVQAIADTQKQLAERLKALIDDLRTAQIIL